ncbi:MAG: hypothetical protein IPK58_04455 [Acidobacteria bacterium]|nr:hypothetical protein [Acidobacteriota bacterium]
MTSQELKKVRKSCRNTSTGSANSTRGISSRTTAKSGERFKLDRQPTQQWTQKFTYDSVGRLKEARETRAITKRCPTNRSPNSTVSATFQEGGVEPDERSESIAVTAIGTGDIDPAKNRFTTASGTAYNDNGQVVTDGKFRNLGYGTMPTDEWSGVAEANSPDAVSVYDAIGNRVAEKVNDVWQFVIYDAFGNSSPNTADGYRKTRAASSSICRTGKARSAPG